MKRTILLISLLTTLHILPILNSCDFCNPEPVNLVLNRIDTDLLQLDSIYDSYGTHFYELSDSNSDTIAADSLFIQIFPRFEAIASTNTRFESIISSALACDPVANFEETLSISITSNNENGFQLTNDSFEFSNFLNAESFKSYNDFVASSKESDNYIYLKLISSPNELTKVNININFETGTGSNHSTIENIYIKP